jgi:hypothetical protein
MFVFQPQFRGALPAHLLSALFGRQSGRRRPIKAGSHLGRECSMRLVNGVRRILGLGGGSHVGGAFCRGSKSVVIPSSVDILCKSFVTDLGSVNSITFEAGCRLQRIEESSFSWSGLRSIVIPHSVEVLCKSCFAECRSIESITFKNDSKLA